MGFKPKPKGIRLTCPPAIWEADDGSDPFEVVIKRLTVGELRDLPGDEAAKDATFPELCAWLAPYIVDWNYTVTNPETGDDEVILPPAEHGPEQMYLLEPLTAAWLYQQVRRVHLGGEDLPKGPRHSNATPAPVNGSASGSRPARAHSRKSQPITTS
jgi:hypothetical protein